jgi:hypothetical protein
MRLLYLTSWLSVVVGLLAVVIGSAVARAAAATQPVVGEYGLFELVVPGPATGNPFANVHFSAKFSCDGDSQSVVVPGFYDDQGRFVVRFMPLALGQWHYVTQSNLPELVGKTGTLLCVAPAPGNHGPVRVHNTYHFAYADGTPFVPIGTTSYGWAQEPDAVEDQTLATLKASPFNKIRMSLLPGGDPIFFPYPQDAAGNWDQSRFNVEFFRHLEKRIAQLGNMGIEADVILFNPYHKGKMQWFDEMDIAGDDRYLHYVVARLSAYHNVWWSLANEYGQVKHRTDADWDHFFQLVQGDDPYGHLRSIHNAAKFYDPNKPWVTHMSIQNGMAVADFGRAGIYREVCAKPAVFDEVQYEGNIDRRWGQLTPQEMVMRFWFGTVAGTYVGHGEIYTHMGEPISWTDKGGKLVGQSPPRIAFLRKILEAGPADGIEPIDEYYVGNIGGKAGEYYLVYFGQEKPSEWNFALPRDPPDKTALTAGMKFHVDVVDTWNMTITPVDRVFTLGPLKDSAYPAVGDGKIALPGTQWMALRIERAD